MLKKKDLLQKAPSFVFFINQSKYAETKRITVVIQYDCRFKLTVLVIRFFPISVIVILRIFRQFGQVIQQIVIKVTPGYILCRKKTIHLGER